MRWLNVTYVLCIFKNNIFKNNSLFKINQFLGVLNTDKCSHNVYCSRCFMHASVILFCFIEQILHTSNKIFTKRS